MTPAAALEPGVQPVADFLTSRTGLSLAGCRRDDILNGIRRAMARAEVQDARRYLALLQGGGVLLDDLISEVTVGETYFFRHPAQFDDLRQTILPTLLRQRRPGHRLRIWSAGCASGEEAYSLAILADQLGAASGVHLLGTDISRDALASARAATYGSWSFRGVDEAVVRRYFQRVGQRWRLDRHLAGLVQFGFLNLALDAYPSTPSGAWAMDLILCRNVLIYLDREVTARMAQGFFATLADGGWLVTGPSDPPLDGDAPFERISTPAGVSYRKPGVGDRPSPGLPPGKGTDPSFAAPAVEPLVPLQVKPPVAGPALVTSPPSMPGTTVAQGGDPVAEAHAALAAGDYDRVMALTDGGGCGPEAAVLRVRAIANRLGVEEAARVAGAEAGRHPLFPGIHYLQAVLLLDLGRLGEAEQAARRIVYLDRSLAAAQFLLGAILRRRGNGEGARQAYRNARSLALARPGAEPVPLAEGELAGRLVAAAEAELALLPGGGGARS
jgi:chemotaxis protein methyltransferase CheR